jgi:integrase/recombinase XerD
VLIKYSGSVHSGSIVSHGEIKSASLFSAIENDKHRLMVELLYGSGMRVSELTNLRIKDLEIENGFGFVRSGKGNKDRLFILSSVLKDKIKELINIDNLCVDDYLFTSMRDGKYNVRSLQMIIKNAVKKSRIEKVVGPHTLRHSFATHLIENGYDVSQVQNLLGHKSPETTMIYVHMASPNMINVKSPIESI